MDVIASPPPPPWPATGRTEGICLDYMHVSSCALGKTSLISLGDSYGKCPARLPVINVPIRSRPSVNLWIQLTCCEMPVADSCLKYRFGSQPTDMTNAFFFWSLLVIQFLLSFIFLSAYSPSVFTASGNEHKANTIFHHHHLHDYNIVCLVSFCLVSFTVVLLMRSA